MTLKSACVKVVNKVYMKKQVLNGDGAFGLSAFSRMCYTQSQHLSADLKTILWTKKWILQTVLIWTKKKLAEMHFLP